MSITDERGMEWTIGVDVQEAFISYFQHLFISGSGIGVDKCLAGVDERISQAMNDQLLAPFTVLEMETALG